MNAYNYFKDLPPWAKAVVVIGGGAALYFAGLSAYRHIRNTIQDKKKKKEWDAEIKDANKAAEAADKELTTLSDGGIKPTMGDSQFQTFASTLVEAMNGCGTDEEAIFNVMRKMKNDADIRKLISIFGVRFYRPCAIDQPVSYARWLIDEKSFGGGLPTWIGYELSGSDIKKIDDIFKANKVNYSF